MKRSEITNAAKVERLDGVNNERLVTVRKRAAHALNLISRSVLTLSKNSIDDCDYDDVLTTVAHAVNLIESAVQDMRWHCEWFDYDDGVCEQLDDSCVDFGNAMAKIIYRSDDNDFVECDLRDGCVKLSKALATLVRWNDDSVDVSEV